MDTQHHAAPASEGASGINSSPNSGLVMRDVDFLHYLEGVAVQVLRAMRGAGISEFELASAFQMVQNDPTLSADWASADSRAELVLGLAFTARRDVLQSDVTVPPS